MNATARPRLFIVSGDDAARDALAALLQAVAASVDAFGSAEAFLADRTECPAGVLLVDASLPGQSGLELQEWLARRRWPLPIVFVTAHADVPTAVEAMKRGAVDFLLHPFAERRLFDAVDAAFARSALADAAPATLPLAVGTLSPREREVLDLILAGYQTRAIAEALFISVKTVEFHRSRIHARLGVSSLAELFSVCVGRRLRTPVKAMPARRPEPR